MTTPLKPKNDNRRKKVLLVGGHAVLRQRLAKAIDGEPDLKVCGESAEGEIAEVLLSKLKPHLVLTILKSRSTGGLRAITEFHLTNPRLKILAVADRNDSAYANRVLQAGAGGYVSQDEELEEIVASIRDLLHGGIYVSEAVLAAKPGSRREKQGLKKKPTVKHKRAS